MEQPPSITDQIIALRRGLGLNQAEFALRIGLANKASVSLLERGGPCSLPVALRLEQLSEGRIDAAALNDDVRAARHSQNIKAARALVHSVIHTVPEGDGRASNSETVGHQETSGSGEAAAADRRVIICDVCERRVDGDIPNACTFVDCPHSQRAGIGAASSSNAVGRKRNAA
jgi:transcriptional regulator with XRE-family HTH domain